jgi:hypothetical protein
MADNHSSGSIELFPRHVFVPGLGAMGAAFVLPGCASNAPAKAPSDVAPTAAPEATASAAASAPSITANAAWESEAKTLEGMGQGIYTAKDTKDQAGKEGSHVPKVMLTGNKVALSTTHPTEAPSERGRTGITSRTTICATARAA